MPRQRTASIVPTNQHPVRIGMDQGGGNKFDGELGRVTVFSQALSESEIRLLANSDRKPLATRPDMVLFRKCPWHRAAISGMGIRPGAYHRGLGQTR